MDYKEFPMVALHEFTYVEVDVIRLDDPPGFAAILNLFLDEPGTDEEEDCAGGVTLDLSIVGDTLKEVADKIALLFAAGIFNDINVGAHGTIWDEDGKEEGVVCWMHEMGALEASASKPTLH